MGINLKTGAALPPCHCKHSWTVSLDTHLGACVYESVGVRGWNQLCFKIN